MARNTPKVWCPRRTRVICSASVVRPQCKHGERTSIELRPLRWQYECSSSAVRAFWLHRSFEHSKTLWRPKIGWCELCEPSSSSLRPVRAQCVRNASPVWGRASWTNFLSQRDRIGFDRLCDWGIIAVYCHKWLGTVLSWFGHWAWNRVYDCITQCNECSSLATRLYILFYECLEFIILHSEKVSCGNPYLLQCTVPARL